ncbi:MAG: NAD(+) diphosphatase [Firmicutes bacterium]|nr:NAD(+) diphosphatase [Bacillota bacterium]
MIQDIYPKKYDNAYHDYGVRGDDYVLIYENGEAVLKNSDYDFFKYSDIAGASGATGATGATGADCYYIYLFSIDDKRFFLLRGAFDMSACRTRIKPLDFRELEPQWKAFAGICGANLAKWYNENRFCGFCGARMGHSKAERAVVCPQCGKTVYPTISPAVIVALTNGGRILMTKYADREYKRYTLIAGYTEIGETLEETVKREVMEEVGLRAKNIRYFGSQPWPFSGTALIGFTAELDGGADITLDTNELSLARWVPRGEVKTEDEPRSLTNTMIQAFNNGEF